MIESRNCFPDDVEISDHTELRSIFQRFQASADPVALAAVGLSGAKIQAVFDRADLYLQDDRAATMDRAADVAATLNRLFRSRGPVASRIDPLEFLQSMGAYPATQRVVAAFLVAAVEVLGLPQVGQEAT